MAVPQRNFIVVDTNYKSSAQYGKRSFCGRCFTTNADAPVGKVVEVYNAEGAKEFFGVGTDEYNFAEKYFSYTTNAGRIPYKLSFVRWTPSNVNGWLKSIKTCPGWGELRKLDLTQYTLEINTTLNQIVLDLSALRNCVGLSDATTTNTLVNILNTQLSDTGFPDFIRGATASIESGCLKIEFPSGKMGDVSNNEVLLPCTGGEIVDVLGLSESSGVICSNFAIGEDTLTAVSRVNSENDDFGSFMFFDWMSSYGVEVLPYLRIQRILKIAEWNANQNYKYMFVEALPDMWDETGVSGNSVYIQDEISTDHPGTAICAFRHSDSNLDMNGYRYEEFLPMAILAATDFESNEATQNYMFQKCDAADIMFTGDYVADIADSFSENNINIYAEVQSVGSERAFLLPGKMLNGEDMSVYACEMYIKEAISTWLINFFLDNEIVRENRNMLVKIAIGIDDIVLAAKENGIISDGIKLDSTQRLYVNNIVGSIEGYKEFEKDGYCLSVYPKTKGGTRVLYYVLVYNKHGQIRKIEGNHIILI